MSFVVTFLLRTDGYTNHYRCAVAAACYLSLKIFYILMLLYFKKIVAKFKLTEINT
jgi:hypothetical protein